MHTVNFPNFLKGLDSSFNKPSNLATDNQAANDWLCDNWSLWQSLLRMNLHTRLVHPGWRISRQDRTPYTYNYHHDIQRVVALIRAKGKKRHT